MPANTVYGGTFFFQSPVVSSKYIPPPPRAYVTKGSYNFFLKSSAEVTLTQAYVLYLWRYFKKKETYFFAVLKKSQREIDCPI